MSRAKYWCFTENNEPEAFSATLEAEGIPEGVTYLCGQLEEGDQEQHLHFQGYCELEARQRLPWLKKNLSPTAHFEVRRGTQEEAISYTQKGDTSIPGSWVEFGEPTNESQGKRNDLLDCKAMLDDGCPMKEIAQAHFGSYIRYHKSFLDYKRLIATPRDSNNPVEVVIYYGPTGTGKSLTARNKDPGAYVKPVGNVWFDGYAGEDTVIFDEYRGNWLPYGTLLAITDRHSCTVPVKGGHVELVARKLVFTTNVHPRNWYRNEYWDAFARRITEFWIHDKDQDPYQDPHPFLTVLPHEQPAQPRNAIPGYQWN